MIVPNDCPLTERELEVIRGLASGKTYQQIALGLFISTSTVRTHLQHTYRKLQVPDRAQTVLYCWRKGWLKSDDGPARGEVRESNGRRFYVDGPYHPEDLTPPAPLTMVTEVPIGTRFGVRTDFVDKWKIVSLPVEDHSVL